jgi:hypothetical protein
MATDRDMSGALFRNDRKEKEAHPDYRSVITIAGVKYWLSGWIKEGKRSKYLSLAATAAEPKPEAESWRAAPVDGLHGAAQTKNPATARTGRGLGYRDAASPKAVRDRA